MKLTDVEYVPTLVPCMLFQLHEFQHAGFTNSGPTVPGNIAGDFRLDIPLRIRGVPGIIPDRLHTCPFFCMNVGRSIPVCIKSRPKVLASQAGFMRTELQADGRPVGEIPESVPVEPQS